MPKGTKTLGNSKALAWESRGFVHKKEDVYILTHPHESFNVLYCKESSQGLHYNVSDKIITYKEKKYFVKMIGYYIKRRLNNVDIYRSDGILSYTNNELKSDKHLIKYIDIPLNRKIIILQKTLSDNGTVFTYEQKGDSMFVNRGNGIIIYVKEIR